MHDSVLCVVQFASTRLYAILMAGSLLTGAFLTGAVGQALAFDPLNGDYTKADPLDVRVVTYNIYGDFIADPSKDAAFNRILAAVRPDVIVFEEIPSDSIENQITGRLDTVLPYGAGSWEIHGGMNSGGIRTVIVSRFPLTMKSIDTIPYSSTRGVTLALVNLPDVDYPVDVYLLGVHLKCCGNPGGSEDAKRQRSADAIASWLGDARQAGGNIDLPADTPMISLGDFNLVGGPQPELTLITGDIQNEATFGPDVKGDWDVSDMTNLMPADPFTGDTFTWQGSGSYDPSALDRFFFTDSVVTVANSFILNTDTMSPAALVAAGLQAGDTLRQNASDHLPIAMDLRLAYPLCGGDAECDDKLFCTGVETCTEGRCESSGDPCTFDEICDEGADACIVVDCVRDTDCDDADACTIDTCTDNVCTNVSPTCVSSFPYAEDFDSGLGGWSNLTSDDIDWTWYTGSTPSADTGPSGDHTSGSGYYLYTESSASSGGHPSKTAIVEGPCFDLGGTSTAMLTFFYHMYGVNTGTLDVEVSVDCVVWTNLFSLSGDQGDFWFQADVDLSAYAGTTITLRFVAITGDGWQSDIAIDDVSLTLTPELVPGDLDQDGDLDLADFAILTDCLLGPNLGQPGLRSCSATQFNLADTDGDQDVDLNDFAVFQALFSQTR